MPSLILIMGVSGCGKTTVARLLADRIGSPFLEADEVHSPANIAKMAAGIPLNDEDRWPWLQDICRRAEQLRLHHNGKPVVLACSALKETYRNTLRNAFPELAIVYLKGDYNLIRQRMEARGGHFMRPAMLRSQFEALEEPRTAVVVDIREPLEAAVSRIVAELALDPK